MINVYKILMNEYRSHKNIGIHCLPLVPFTLLVNCIKNYDTIDKNSYWLTSFLIINYVFVSILWIKIKNFYSITFVLSLILISIGFAFCSNYLLSSDSLCVIFIFGLLSNYFYIETIDKLPTIFKSSFSFGELLIVSQTSVAYLSTAIGCAVTKLLDSNNYQIFCSDCLPNHVIQIIFVGIFSIIISLMIIFWLKTERACLSSIRIKYFDLQILFVVILLTHISLSKILNEISVFWLIDFVIHDQNRINLMIIWLTIMSITLVFTYCYTIWAKDKATTIVRKFFHISISIVYLIGMKLDFKFLIFSSAVILSLFIMIEIIRIKKLPFGETIESIFKKFRDEKDRGYLTLTHIYLLVGCSLPLWIYPFDQIRSPSAIASGVITVGFGDTAASIGGSLLGKHYWSGSLKTYEGTCFATITQLISSLLICKYLMPNFLFSLYNISLLSLISIIVAIIEAKITQIDNLVLPLYYYILITIFID